MLPLSLIYLTRDTWLGRSLQDSQASSLCATVVVTFSKTTQSALKSNFCVHRIVGLTILRKLFLYRIAITECVPNLLLYRVTSYITFSAEY